MTGWFVIAFLVSGILFGFASMIVPTNHTLRLTVAMVACYACAFVTLLFGVGSW